MGEPGPKGEQVSGHTSPKKKQYSLYSYKLTNCFVILLFRVFKDREESQAFQVLREKL